ncbi:transporter substrate-binding domain-containing protein [Duganella sp. FT3S]|uniref:Transporter substrate-binding domain-containing protein n=1 Tax=Rugamonas fusca TaxID=2758568 RepID=A0A7W2EM80_9BURK|nr:transporter substrate-binding domain-containing protein [Rugamonas fusca]MBA5608476.1 transporter substrate-binding domain-containing protein [Rugamonas fusca]
MAISTILTGLRNLPIVLATAAGLAQAAPTPNCSRTYTLAYHEHGMLYSKALDQGIDKDVAEEMIKRSGCKFTVTVMPRARIWALIESGQLDFSMSGITNPERDKFAAFGWYLFNKYYLLVRKDAGVRSIDDFQRRQDLSLGTIRSFRYSERFNHLADALRAENRINEVVNHEQLLGMLKLNRIQGIIIEPFNYSQVQQRELSELTNLFESDDPSVLHGLIMSKRSLSPEDQQQWRNIIDGMRRDGTLFQIMRKYFGDRQAKAMTTF